MIVLACGHWHTVDHDRGDRLVTCGEPLPNGEACGRRSVVSVTRHIVPLADVREL